VVEQVLIRRTVVGALAVLALALAGCQPNLSGIEFKNFYDRYEPMPGSVRLTTPPPITGHARADARIRSIAESRGYRLRSLHTGTLVTVAGVPLDKVAAGQLTRLLDRARSSGYTLSAGYGFRSVALQRSLFLNRISGYSNDAIADGRADSAINAALMWVAAPGYSKHHSGFAVDLRAGGALGPFGDTPVGRWLSADNYRVAKQFGFIPSYPPGAGAQGPEPEPWEYVYVGVKAIDCSPHLFRDNDRPAFDTCVNPPPTT